MSFWSPAEELILADGFEKGQSGREISKRLTGRSRNAVIGKLHRMGLTRGADAARIGRENYRRACANRPGKTDEQLEAERQYRSAYMERWREKRRLRDAERLAKAVPKPAPVPLGDKVTDIFGLKHDSCRFVVGEDRHGAVYCGEPGEKSWCAHHKAIVFVPAKEARKSDRFLLSYLPRAA